MDTKLMIFDLDGTLLDTIGDLAACCDHVLAARGLPWHTYEEYCGFVGNGVMRLVERALPEELRTPETVAAVRAVFVAYYTENIDRFTRPYEGIPELLRELVQRGIRLAVASNKFQIGTEKLVRIYFPSIRFDAVFGQRPGVPLKPDPQVVREILADTGAASGAALYAGFAGCICDALRAHAAAVCLAGAPVALAYFVNTTGVDLSAAMRLVQGGAFTPLMRGRAPGGNAALWAAWYALLLTAVLAWALKSRKGRKAL